VGLHNKKSKALKNLPCVTTNFWVTESKCSTPLIPNLTLDKMMSNLLSVPIFTKLHLNFILPSHPLLGHPSGIFARILHYLLRVFFLAPMDETASVHGG
jgi:hypothetical protein